MTSPDPKKPKLLVGHVTGDEKDLPEGVVLHKSRSPDAPERVARQPIVLDDPQQIAKCRRAFEQTINELHKQAMTRIRQGEWLYPEHRHALQERPSETFKGIHELLADTSALPVARAKAAQTLASSKVPEGESFLFDALHSESVEMRRAALKILRDSDSRAINFSTTNRAAVVLSLLHDEDEGIVQAAGDLCSFRRIPGAEAEMLAVLKSRELQDAGQFAQKLAEVATTREAVDTILPHIRGSLPQRFPHYHTYVFRHLLENPDPNVREPVRKAICEIALQYQADRYDQSLVRELAVTADHDSIPVLEDILANATDPSSRTSAVEALARLKPNEAVDLVLDLIKSQGPRFDIVQELRKYAEESDYDRIVPVILSSLAQTGEPIHSEIVRLCLNELGERGRALVQDRMDDLDDHARMLAQWKLKNVNLRTVLGELHEAGVISIPPDQLLSKMQEAESKRSQSLDMSEPYELTGAFCWDVLLVMFDAETSTIPCPHDRLIRLFAECTGHRFQPHWPVQFWHQEDESDYDAPYTLQFVYRDRLFRIGAENFGDWYDVEAVVRLLNFALETTGQPQRFIGLAGGGQCPSFVFADPNAFIPIANKYGLPLSEDASAAMRAGIEYERHVTGNDAK